MESINDKCDARNRSVYQESAVITMDDRTAWYTV
jgi:hypothetical protein